MKKGLLIIVLLLTITVLLIACKQQPPPQPPEQPPEQPPPTPAPCANYIRNGVIEQHCAVCGNNICEPFESCTPSECTLEGCTRDCGTLYCEQDCKQQDLPVLKPGTLPEITASIRTCNTAADCVRVKADCCGCTMSGQAAALNRKYEPDWQSTLKQKCVNIACLQALSSHWTCFADIKCVKNKCTLVRSGTGSSY